MKTTVLPQDFCAGVFAVPPLARRTDSSRTLDFEQNNLIVRHILSGGITRLLYGGNAFLYHLTLTEYEHFSALYTAHVTQAEQGCDFDFLHFGAETPEPEIH